MPTTRYRFLITITFLLTLLCHSPARATEYPAGFTETRIAFGMSSVTRMDISPDGRIFVCEQGGNLRVIKNGVLLSTPFVTVQADSFGEHGLLGIAFDPNFNTNKYIYLYYTATTPTLHNRVSRFTANGDVALAGSETIIFDLDTLTGELGWHQGGNLRFGPDGKLYIAVGDDRNGANSQSKSNLFGKILRIDKDGTIPTDNPFYSTTTGKNRAIWAIGLRNPYSYSFQPGTARMFINDVGEETWEEINDGIAGSNYGWPDTEGFTSDPRFRSPLFVYGHGYDNDTLGCAVTAGAFYNPVTQQFPPQYRGFYFYTDFCQGWIRKLNPADNTSEVFGRFTYFPVDLKVTDDGSIYYLERGIDANTDGAVFKIQYTGNAAPSITSHPTSTTVSIGQSATFTVSASGSTPLIYQWQRNGSDIDGAYSATYTISNVQSSDNGAVFRAVVTNSFGTVTSNGATLTVTNNVAPTGTITSPPAGTKYRAGDTINYAGAGSDPEDGSLPASAFTWQVDFHHDTHTHPFIPPATGAKSGSFTIPANGETATNVWYRIYLTVRDSAGATHTSFRDITPIVESITIATNPTGLQIKLDDQPRTAPVTVDNVAGMNRIIEAVSPQTVGGVTYEFVSWSDGGAAAHTVNSAGTYTATYRIASQPPSSGDVVMYASEAGVRAGNYSIIADPSAAGGARLLNPDAGAAKLASALANPATYFETTFTAQAGTAYRLWIRAKAQNDDPFNDSIFVQFSDSVTSSGAATSRIGTTSSEVINLEDCFGCGLSGWGWQDNGWGIGVMGPLIYFQTSGTHTLRIQPREDGLSIDQVVLSPQTYLNSSPGALINDSTILPRTGPSETLLLADDFNNDSLDASKWTVNDLFSGYTDANVPALENSQRLEIGPLMQNLDGSHYNGIRSATTYDFTGAYCYVQLLQIPASATAADAMFTIGFDVDNYYRLYVESGTLTAQKKIGGAKTSFFTASYNSTQHKYLRIRHEAQTGKVIFEAASDTGAGPGNWVQLYSEAWNTLSVPLTGIIFELKAGTYRAESSPPGTAIFDNFRAAKP